MISSQMIGRFFFAGILLLATSVSSEAVQSLEVRDLRVHLFYEHSGRLSQDITDQSDLVLWNTPIGGGDALEPASVLFVVVEIRGPKSYYSSKNQLRIQAISQNDERLLLDEVRSVGVTDEQGSWASAFLITDATCDALLLRAEVTGRDSVYSEKIEFRCGE